jgi:UDP-sugar diphosphatase
MTLYYAEVTDAMRGGRGGGLVEEGEMIDVVELSVEETRKLIMDESVNRPVGMLFALQWFFMNKWQKAAL